MAPVAVDRPRLLLRICYSRRYPTASFWVILSVSKGLYERSDQKRRTVYTVCCIAAVSQNGVPLPQKNPPKKEEEEKADTVSGSGRATAGQRTAWLCLDSVPARRAVAGCPPSTNADGSGVRLEGWRAGGLEGCSSAAQRCMHSRRTLSPPPPRHPLASLQRRPSASHWPSSPWPPLHATRETGR